jgi:RNA polymerase sigma-70 factor (ECF subfamily)
LQRARDFARPGEHVAAESLMQASPEAPAAHDDATARLYADCYPELIRFLKRVSSDAAQAEDLAQEAGIRLIALARREPVENPRAFLFHAAANLARDQLRRRMVADGHAALQMLPEPALGADHVASAREEVAVVAKEIQNLPRRAREVLLLARVEGLAQKEIAARLGLAPKTVENHLTRALAQLTARLRRGGRQ